MSSKILKICLLILWASYILACNIYTPSIQKIVLAPIYEEALLKSEQSALCSALLGGSNVRQGILAEMLSSPDCRFVNLGISAELGHMDNYITWLKQFELKGKTLIYSSNQIWLEYSKLNEYKKFLFFNMPKYSLANIIYYNIFATEKSYASKFSKKFHDERNIKCIENRKPFDVDVKKLAFSNATTAQVIATNIHELSRSLQARVIFRVPPMLVSKDSVNEYQQLIETRVDFLKQQGVLVLDARQYAYSDSRLFCDTVHPTEIGRRQFTNDIKDELPL